MQYPTRGPCLKEVAREPLAPLSERHGTLHPTTAEATGLQQRPRSSAHRAAPAPHGRGCRGALLAPLAFAGPPATRLKPHSVPAFSNACAGARRGAVSNVRAADYVDRILGPMASDLGSSRDTPKAYVAKLRSYLNILPSGHNQDGRAIHHLGSVIQRADALPTKRKAMPHSRSASAAAMYRGEVAESKAKHHRAGVGGLSRGEARPTASPKKERNSWSRPTGASPTPPQRRRLRRLWALRRPPPRPSSASSRPSRGRPAAAPP